MAIDKAGQHVRVAIPHTHKSSLTGHLKLDELACRFSSLIQAMRRTRGRKVTGICEGLSPLRLLCALFHLSHLNKTYHKKIASPSVRASLQDIDTFDRGITYHQSKGVGWSLILEASVNLRASLRAFVTLRL